MLTVSRALQLVLLLLVLLLLAVPMLAVPMLAVPLLAVPLAGATEPSGVLAHHARLVFNLDDHSVVIVDELDVPAGVSTLHLGAGFKLQAIAGPKGPVEPVDKAWQLTASSADFITLDLTACGVGAEGGTLELTYRGVFQDSVNDVTFSRENVGAEVQATITDGGVYLSSMARWLAWHDDLMATHDITCDTPAGFETVTQGRRTLHEERAGRLLTRWVAANPADGLNLIANRYFVHEEPVAAGIVGQTFFLEDDARLRATYMERTKAYIAMYEEMIGPYPYAKFATVENWFPTGYGMPSFTLLGSQVLRLPFIPYTSFGHEIAHNWWGNSVFVNLDEGNWCEGLTVYCADYHYEQLKGDEEAKQYRRRMLKDYAAYVRDPANDFPLNEFVARHSGATRAVGYGKSMMVFHMAQRKIGYAAFVQGLRQVAKDFPYKKAAYSDFFDAFKSISGVDFALFQKQWLQRSGAARLDLENVEFKKNSVRFDLVQPDPTYDLQVPVVTSAGQKTLETVLHLRESRQSFEVRMDGVDQVAIDPDCHLFRHLHPEEIEPTLSRVLAETHPTLVLDNAPPMEANAGRDFARAFTESDHVPEVTDGVPPVAGADGHVPSNLVINPGTALLKSYLNQELVVAGDLFFVAGKRYSLKEYDLVFCAANPHDPQTSDLVVLSRSPQRLTKLGSRLGHYGKYSYLIFPSGRGKVERGNWEPGASPLVSQR